MLTSAFGAREPNSCTNHIHLFFKSKNETVSRGGFHWKITHPGVGVFLCFFWENGQHISALRGRLPGPYVFCVMLRAQSSACARWMFQKYIMLSCYVFFCVLFVALSHFACIYCIRFFLLLFSLFLHCWFRRGFALFTPPPWFICCLGIEYTMHYNFCFCYAFLPTLCIFFNNNNVLMFLSLVLLVFCGRTVWAGSVRFPLLLFCCLSRWDFDSQIFVLCHLIAPFSLCLLFLLLIFCCLIFLDILPTLACVSTYRVPCPLGPSHICFLCYPV